MDTPTNQLVRTTRIIPDNCRCQAKMENGEQCPKRFIFKGRCKTHIPKDKKKEWKAIADQITQAFTTYRDDLEPCIVMSVRTDQYSTYDTSDLLAMLGVFGTWVTFGKAMDEFCRAREYRLLEFYIGKQATYNLRNALNRTDQFAYIVLELSRRGVPIPSFPVPTIDIPEAPCEDLRPRVE